MKTITFEHASSLLSYDRETGFFFWKVSGSGRDMAKPAGTTSLSGYVMIYIEGEAYRAHRLAFLLMTGRLPTSGVDHVDGNRANNKWHNLRDATDAENQQNRKLQSNNSSGLMGVSYIPRLGQWRAEICTNGQRKHIGCFASASEAHLAYAKEKAMRHKFNPSIRT